METPFPGDPADLGQFWETQVDQFTSQESSIASYLVKSSHLYLYSACNTDCVKAALQY